jgi:hypothetical protein
MGPNRLSAALSHRICTEHTRCRTDPVVWCARRTVTCRPTTYLLVVRVIRVLHSGPPQQTGQRVPSQKVTEGQVASSLILTASVISTDERCASSNRCAHIGRISYMTVR